MAIPILPIIGAISDLASPTWEIYRKATEAKRGKRDEQAKEALAKRIEELEDSAFEQTRVLSELSKDLNDFAQAIQEEIAGYQKRERRLRAAVYFALAVGLLSLGISVMALLK